MSKQLEKELLEVAQWYTFHKSDQMDIEKRLEFLTKSVDLLIWALAKATEDIQVLESRKRSGIAINDPYITSALPRSLRTATGLANERNKEQHS